MKITQILSALVTIILLVAIDNLIAKQLVPDSLPMRLLLWGVIGVNATLLYWATKNYKASEE